MDDGDKGQTWELAKLIGRYETSQEMTNERLGKIEKHLEKFSEIDKIMATKAEKLDNIEDRTESLENDGLTKRRRLQIDGTTLATIILGFKEIILAILRVGS